MQKTIICVLGLVIITGCGQKTDYNKIMEGYAKNYYESYMKGVQGQDRNNVSIESLKNVNDKMGGKYDLSKLSKCKDDSYVTVLVDHKTREIKNYEFHLNCK